MRNGDIAAFAAILVSATFGLTTQAEETRVDFNRDVRPILSAQCFNCHGQDEGSREGGLRLDLRDQATAELDSGLRAVVPGDERNSELLERITTDDEFARMPPTDVGDALKAEEVALLRQWIREGAHYARHWAYVAPQRWPLPAISDSDWAREALDYFVAARLQKEGLRPSEEANRYALVRRLSFDLRGLPPTPQEMERFIAEQTPQAYERLVDRFLSDPAFGEHWARVWLDLARYADSRGYGSDPLRTNMWRYRDWVIDAYNENTPFNQFTIEQLAGDLLPNATLQQRIATAFHRNTMTNTEGGTDDEEFRVAAVKDRAETTIRVWMGLTMQCANCHEHKYDPISHEEYYQFYAIFNQTADADRPDETPTMEAPTALILDQRQRTEDLIAQLERQIKQLSEDPSQNEKKTDQLRDRIAQAKESQPAIPTVPVMQELPQDKHRTAFVMVRGNFLSPGESVAPGYPSAFHQASEDKPVNRLGAAKWLVDEANPLTARVAVNRVWARLFGIGLVETEEDFGTQGEPPSHPLLLDWLASEFMRTGWDHKRFLRTIVTSATYRQTSVATPPLIEKDPRNRLLARGPRFRLEAETVRDQALALSGLLSRKVHGPSVYPYQPAGLWRAAFNGQRTWPTSKGEDKYRRGLYTFLRRTVPYPSMQAFDAPSRELCTLRRIRTNTPIQAFVTLNDPVYVEAAQALARRILREGGETSEQRVRFALKLCLCRPAAAAQVQMLVRLLESEKGQFQEHPNDAEQLATNPLGPVSEGTDLAELASWTVVANVLLNLDAVLSKG